jgi:hypothetical protein
MTDEPSTREAACFEAGIKFGSLYHQFAGTPLSLESADSLARAMEDAIENQPFCETVEVTMREAAIRDALADQDADYTEWTGRYSEVRMTIEYEGTTVETRMAMDGDYPLMAVESVTDD